MTTYRVFSERDIEIAQAYDGSVLIERACPVCGDPLLGGIDTGGEVPECEEGYHGTRQGVSYVGKDINE